MSTPPYRSPASNGPGHCPRCQQRVLWCLTDANRRTIPVDPAEDPTGNQAVRIDGEGRYWARQLSKARPAPEQREVLRRPHIATCPTPAPTPAPRPRLPRERRGTRPTQGWRR